jgi:hypothetical protein
MPIVTPSTFRTGGAYPLRPITIKVPTKYRMPRFGLGNFYRATPVTHAPLSGLGNVIRSIGQFYRQSSAFLPTAINPDLTTNCPAAAAGSSCPAALPGSYACPARATGRTCPVQTVTKRRNFPSFGLGGLRGYSGNYYVDTASGYSVEAMGAGAATIFDSAGDTIYQSGSGGLLQNYGPFYVDADGNIYVGAVEVWDTQDGLTGVAPPATASAAPAVATATKAVATSTTQAPGSGFWAAPVGYQTAAAPAPLSTSWFDKSTTLFGMTLKNSDLAAVLGIGGLFVVMSQRKRR